METQEAPQCPPVGFDTPIDVLEGIPLWIALVVVFVLGLILGS